MKQKGKERRHAWCELRLPAKGEHAGVRVDRENKGLSRNGAGAACRRSAAAPPWSVWSCVTSRPRPPPGCPPWRQTAPCPAWHASLCLWTAPSLRGASLSCSEGGPRSLWRPRSYDVSAGGLVHPQRRRPKVIVAPAFPCRVCPTFASQSAPQFGRMSTAVRAAVGHAAPWCLVPRQSSLRQLARRQSVWAPLRLLCGERFRLDTAVHFFTLLL